MSLVALGLVLGTSLSAPGGGMGMLAGVLDAMSRASGAAASAARAAAVAAPGGGGGEADRIAAQVDALTRAVLMNGAGGGGAAAANGYAAYAALAAVAALAVHSASRGDDPGDEPHWLDGLYFVSRRMFRRGIAATNRAVGTVGAALADARASLEARLDALRGMAETTAEDAAALRREVARIEETLQRTEAKVDTVLVEQRDGSRGIRLLCGAAAAAFRHAQSDAPTHNAREAYEAAARQFEELPGVAPKQEALPDNAGGGGGPAIVARRRGIGLGALAM